MDNEKQQMFSTNLFGYNKTQVEDEIFKLRERIKTLEGDLVFIKKAHIDLNNKFINQSNAYLILSQKKDMSQNISNHYKNASNNKPLIDNNLSL